jgi:hypothetical protein
MYVVTAWNDYFSTTNPTKISSQTYNSRQTPSGTNVYITNCLFRSMTSTYDGGALSFTSSTNLLIESSSFFSCKTSGSYGGSIYFSNSGQCVLDTVCGYDCCSTRTSSNSHGQFTWIGVKNDVSSKNYINYSSASRCVNTNSGSRYSVCPVFGKIHCPSVNISMNKCQYDSGISTWPFADSNSITCSLLYSTFADNNAIERTCIYLWRGGANFEIKSCNIIRNTQVSLSSGGMIYTNGNLMIEDSCILENTANYIFCQETSYTITLSNCTVDSTSNNGYLTTRNTVTKNFILALNHMSTHNCHSEYDLAGYLTPNIQTPSSSKKQRLYYSCVVVSRLRDFVSLLSLFLINFIHQDVSGDLFY